MNYSAGVADVGPCDYCQKHFTAPLERDHPNWAPVSFWNKRGIEVGLLKRCATCMVSRYCSKSCFDAHGKEHKKVCVPINKTPSCASEPKEYDDYDDFELLALFLSMQLLIRPRH